MIGSAKRTPFPKGLGVSSVLGQGDWLHPWAGAPGARSAQSSSPGDPWRSPGPASCRCRVLSGPGTSWRY